MRTGLITPWEAYQSLDNVSPRPMRLVGYPTNSQDYGYHDRLFFEDVHPSSAVGQNAITSRDRTRGQIWLLTELDACHKLLYLQIPCVIERLAVDPNLHQGDMLVGDVEEYVRQVLKVRMRNSQKRWQIDTLNDVATAAIFFLTLMLKDAARGALGHTRSIRRDTNGEKIYIESSVTIRPPLSVLRRRGAPKPISVESQPVTITSDDQPKEYTSSVSVYATVKPVRPDYVLKSDPNPLRATAQKDENGSVVAEPDHYQAAALSNPDEFVWDVIWDIERDVLVEELFCAIIARLEKSRSVAGRRLAAIFVACRNKPELFSLTEKKVTFHAPAIAAEIGENPSNVRNALRALGSVSEKRQVKENLRLGPLEKELLEVRFAHKRERP